MKKNCKYARKERSFHIWVRFTFESLTIHIGASAAIPRTGDLAYMGFDIAAELRCEVLPRKHRIINRDWKKYDITKY
jgi:hypothetical protein